MRESDNVTVSARLPRELVEAIDEERSFFEFPPSRTDVMERVLVDWVKERRAWRKSIESANRGHAVQPNRGANGTE
jgi:hypothetical protein